MDAQRQAGRLDAGAEAAAGSTRKERKGKVILAAAWFVLSPRGPSGKKSVFPETRSLGRSPTLVPVTCVLRQEVSALGPGPQPSTGAADQVAFEFP